MQLWMLEYQDEESEITLRDGVYASQDLALAWARCDAQIWAECRLPIEGEEVSITTFETEVGQPGIEAKDPSSGCSVQWSTLPVTLTTQPPKPA